MSPPSTPRGPIFSPRQEHDPMAWCYRTFSLASPTKRLKLEPVEPNRPAPLRKPSINPIQPANSNKNTLLRSATLASRRLRRNAPAKLPLEKSAAETPLLGGSPGASSTGLSPIVKGLSLGIDKRQNTPTPLSTQQYAAESKPAPPQQQPMRFRLQKPAPTTSVAKKEKASKVPKLKLGAATGLVSPPSETVPGTASRGRSRPPALSLAAASPLASAGIDVSQGMPQTPGTATGTFNLVDNAMFGEASPSLYAQPTPPPIEGAPVFEITPPSPATVLVPENNAAEQPSSSLAPCTPPWPKSGASLRKTLFDHIGQNQLSPMDMRGYMAISMNS
ncbi:hypothetical protein EV183_005060 [Coemansia sp. RSA 2336]|nr:hypothetical protein EV183_005060 [Coemansia sp. RSA 2336]